MVKRPVTLVVLLLAVSMQGDWRREVLEIYRSSIGDGTLMGTFRANTNLSARTLIEEVQL
jgi:hypothetical protein